MFSQERDRSVTITGPKNNLMQANKIGGKSCDKLRNQCYGDKIALEKLLAARIMLLSKQYKPSAWAYSDFSLPKTASELYRIIFQ